MTIPGFSLAKEAAAELLADIDAGLALPTRWYGDPAIFAAELERIHRRSWHFVAHTGELAEDGAVFLRNVAGVPIVLVRDPERGIRGFLNLCRHRGHPVVLESGTRRTLQCRYHGWSYNLDGSLRGAPRSESSLDRAELGLIPVQTHVWEPMVWVNLDRGAPPFERWIEGMPELLRRCGLQVERHVLGFQNEWEISANWKVFQDNTIECYHCPTSHPELSRVLEMRPEKQEFHVGGRYWIHHRIPFRPGITSGITFKAVEGQPFYYYYNWIFPTTYLQHAGRGFDIGTVDVVAVDRIRFRHICFLPPDTPAEILARGKSQLDLDPTIWQDVDICNRVQLGHATGLAPRGRLLPGPEFLLQHVQRLIVEMLADS